MAMNRGLSALERGIPQGILGGAVGGLFVGLLQAKGYLPGGVIVWVFGTALMGLAAWYANHALLSTGERVATSVYVPSGDTTAYVPTFSHIEALEIRGDLDGAATAWAEARAAHPANALVVVKSADFELRLRKDPQAALVLYRAAREIRGASGELLRYAQAKIVDLHLGPLADEGRAMVELRRLIEGFPGTREADEARAALARIKAARNEA